MSTHIDTIAAIATPPGRGGVGIIRVSGPQTKQLSQAILKKVPKARYAYFSPFYDHNDEVMDEGLALWFPGPNSFTGEDVLELQGHGGPVVLDRILKRLLSLGARLARPGEFSERAFLNDKIDLTQAEAIADLIDAGTEQAARSALRSLQGEFSQKIHDLLEKLIKLRMYVEAAIDFPEEEIDFLADKQVQQQITQLITAIDTVFNSAKQGSLLRDGISIVIAGRPNAGKSSLLNCLSGRESAIVTEIPGTTRDVLREYIHIDGLPLHIIDTAGLRVSEDRIEQEGVRRTWQEIEKADHVLLLVDSNETDATAPEDIWPEFIHKIPASIPITVVKNKIDLVSKEAGIKKNNGNTIIAISAKHNQGIDLLREHLKECAGFSSHQESTFIARRRHLDALTKAKQSIETGYQQLQEHRAGELLAEDLRYAQHALSEITGEFTSDDLLGQIFSSFCIGK